MTWSTEHELVADAAPADVWPLWSDHRRWCDWNHEVASVRLRGPLARGMVVRGTRYALRFRGSLPLRFAIVALEHERELTDEGRLPGVRMGHQRQIVPAGDRVRIRNRVYLEGPLARAYGVLIGGRLRNGVRRFVEREKELAEQAASGRNGSRP